MVIRTHNGLKTARDVNLARLKMPHLFGLSSDGKLFSAKHPGWNDVSKPAGATSLLRQPDGFGYQRRASCLVCQRFRRS
jgi:hypothetical protein